MTLFNPPIFQFYPCTKTSERVFRSFSSSNSSKFRKIHSEVRIQGKKNFGKRVPKFKIRGKNGNPRGKKSHGGWEEKISDYGGKKISINRPCHNFLAQIHDLTGQ
jgi:hypothetical protein